jgi:hypothetical protein
MILMKTLSLLVNFTYIFMDIIIYTLRSTLWSSGSSHSGPLLGSSHSGPLLGPFESMRGGTLGTNPHQ